MYHKELAQGETVNVVTIEFNKRDGMKLTKSLPTAVTEKTIWGLKTNQFHPVQTFMYSPNWWDDQHGVGNQHFVFMLSGCLNDNRPNGFFNEYLREDFMKQKRVFEALGSKMRVEPSDSQLSGLGFSSTIRNNLVCKVDNRPYNIIF